ncbi:FeoA family protein [Beduini massiliensis]|uniref:FeoA family protein n=1 Tax=Beduini massiliensis TaxID=1585974 RepID=UPI0009441280|nr:FeoA family protein [Beduini massiliensis]
MIKMNTLEEGQIGYVKNINTNGSMRRRLQDIGLIIGTKIECILKSPAGDPIAYDIRGAVIALRNEDAQKIIINEVDRFERNTDTCFSRESQCRQKHNF